MVHVSVIIPVYNGASFLNQAIETVQKQNYADLDIIVVDDGSTDQTAAVAQSFGATVRYVHQDHSGPALARNQGLAVAQGEVIAFLDVDDLWPLNKLALQLQRLAEAPSVDIVCGYTQCMRRVEENDEPDIAGTPVEGEKNCKLNSSASLKYFPGDIARFEALFEPFLCLHLGSSIFRKSVFDTVGHFDIGQAFSEDFDWFTRARELGVPIAILKDITLFYHRHQTNMTLHRTEHDLHFVRAIKKSMDRRRQNNQGTVVPLEKL